MKFFFDDYKTFEDRLVYDVATTAFFFNDG